jgi:hypothetical protein
MQCPQVPGERPRSEVRIPWSAHGVAIDPRRPPDRMPRIGVLTPFAANDAEGHARLTAFAQGLQQLGWAVGQNIRIDYRWGDGKPASMRSPYKFRKIQGCPKDLPPALRQAEFAVS